MTHKTPTIRRVAITGPESTGKSELAEQLAIYYGTTFVPEYARYYIARLQRPYLPDDLVQIAYTQIALEDRYAQRYSQNGLLFCDTEMIVIKIWYEHAFGDLPPHLAQLFVNRLTTYSAYLLADIDLEWKPDPQREHPYLRQYFFDRYYATLQQNAVSFSVISGSGSARLQNAVAIIDELIAR